MALREAICGMLLASLCTKTKRAGSELCFDVLKKDNPVTEGPCTFVTCRVTWNG